ncbi:MAG TPA: uroporphyrinogen-III C-methyltransferase [Bryobacteraceae bacterium]|nr:uroporphyrinogen-III C-methyltransferase [Bryobacteraceae bacterium]
MKPVYLVGAGPGDPDLITCKGRSVLELADVVLHDHLANEALLRLAPAHAELIYVGKKKAVQAHTQEEICAMMIERARRGLAVVRLKGGDPFIFGRGGEEAEALADAGIPFEVVPGVTSPLGIAAYTGIPLTHRNHTSVVTFVTGHSVDQIDWSKIGSAETLVIFMGLTTFPQIAAEIMARGRSPETPAIAVRWGTRPDQETVAGTLATLPRLLQERGLKPPATIIVGEVVKLREKLNWLEKLPLFGRRIVVTRARDQAESLSRTLRALGADVIEMPAIEIVPAADYGPLDRAIAELNSYDWLIFTSANGVRYFMERLDQSKQDLRALRARICAIGDATRRAIGALHLQVDLIGEEFVAESLVEAFRSVDLEGKRVLLPRAAVARDILPLKLCERGACVDVVEAYRSAAPEELAKHAGEAFSGGRKPDWITFTSSSTVQNFTRAAGADVLRGVRVASIGPVTSATAKKLGLEITVQAKVFTSDGLVEAIVEMEAQRERAPSK